MKKLVALLTVAILSLAIAAPAQQGDPQKKGDAKGGIGAIDPAQLQKLMDQFGKGGIGKGGQAQTTVSPADGFDASWRMRAFEAVFEEHPDARKRATPALNAVMKGAFSPNPLNVSAEFDKARLAMLYPKGPDAAAIWAASLSVRPSTRLLETGVKPLTIKLAAFYDAKVPVPKDAAVELRLEMKIGKEIKGIGTHIKFDTLPVETTHEISDLQGDCTLRAQIKVADKVLHKVDQTVSFVTRPGERLAKLNAAIAALPNKMSIEKNSATNLAAALTSMFKGELQSQSFAADAMLTEAEAVVAALAAGKDYYTAERAGSFWLMVPTGNAVVPCRVFIPDSVKKEKAVPLVFALHGMGGNEHMFFDSYHQKIVKLCQDRGWILVSPTGKGSAPPLPALIDELARRYPVDKSQVFVIGHSMGAGHAMSLVSAAPQRYAAVAPLGGAGQFKASDDLKKVAFFIGVGTDDSFFLTSARSMHKSLKSAGVQNAVLREYKDIEHIMVVQVAAADVFAFFDEVAKKLWK